MNHHSKKHYSRKISEGVMPYRPESELKRPDLKGNFTCTVCGKIFCHSSSLNRHRMNVHVQSHRCTLCNQEISKEESLRSHMQTRHAVSRVFFCRCCNWAFPDKKNLHLHTISMMRGAGPGDCQILARNDGGPLLAPAEISELLDSSAASSPSSSHASQLHGSESPASGASPTRNVSQAPIPASVPKVSRKRQAAAPTVDSSEQLRKITALLQQSGAFAENGALSGATTALGGGDIAGVASWLQTFLLNNALINNDQKEVEVKLSGAMSGDALRLTNGHSTAADTLLSVQVPSDSPVATPSPSVADGGSTTAASTPASSAGTTTSAPRKNRRKLLTPRHHIEAATVIDDPSMPDWNDNTKLATEVMF